jgi:hypothetical protein
MNEQQVADLFSEQLDRMLQGEPPALPAEAGDLPELLDLGRQYSQMGFRAGFAGQAAFQAQMASWFGANVAAPATLLGLSKSWFISLSVVLLAVGTGLGFMFLGTPQLGDPGYKADTVPEKAMETPGPMPVERLEDKLETGQPPISNSLEDVIPVATTSLEDMVPGATVTLEETVPLTSTSVPDSPASPAELSLPDAESEDGSQDETNSGGDGQTGGNHADNQGDSDGSEAGDHNRGHGNDRDGHDEENPGHGGSGSSGNHHNRGNQRGKGN